MSDYKIPEVKEELKITTKTSLNKEQKLKLYHYLLLTRGLDERIASLYRQSKVFGGVYGGRGEEATAVGAAFTLEKGDVVAPMIRNAGAFYVRGLEPKRFLANFLGKTTAPSKGKDGNTHFGDLELGIFAPISMLSAMIPICCGAALAFKMRNEKRVAMTWTGDGASSLGDFHEGINFAAVNKLPLVLFIQNNQYAYSTPRKTNCVAKNFVDKAVGYGIEGFQVDGNNVLEVYETTKKAVEKARNGEGPVLIESITMRMRGHAEHDDFFYVPKDFYNEWLQKDPVSRFEVHLHEQEKIGIGELIKIQEDVKNIVDEAEKFALESPFPAPESAKTGVFC
ncbi:thiamine pyrophosphate-dependent dehydrogenase E1 component subunit alpha [bacterium]|nr:thiamine pyrophosphate-dependent dehydrogenase E1 component subunit alpha [bacterium]